MKFYLHLCWLVNANCKKWTHFYFYVVYGVIQHSSDQVNYLISEENVMVPQCGNLLMYPCSPLACIQSVSIPELPRPDNILNVNYWHINTTSTMPSLRTSYEVGLDFLQFLGQRISKTDINELRDIYNFEFKRFATVTQSHRFSVWLTCFTSFALFCLCNKKVL